MQVHPNVLHRKMPTESHTHRVPVVCLDLLTSLMVLLSDKVFMTMEEQEEM